MIGGILPNSDLNIFLTDSEVELLNLQTVKGIVIKLSDKKHVPLELNIDGEKSKSTIFAEEGDIYRVFVSRPYYVELKTKGFVGTRNVLGWKIDLTTEKYATMNPNLNSELQLLNRLRNY